MDRSFPFRPNSAAQLEVGDIVAVPCELTGWTCLVVVDLQRQGRGARSTFVAGVVDWSGERPPREDDIFGLPVIAQGLTPTTLFTEGGLQVVGNVGPIATSFDSSYRDHLVGAIHRVWGWRAAIRRAQERGAIQSQ